MPVYGSADSCISEWTASPSTVQLHLNHCIMKGQFAYSQVQLLRLKGKGCSRLDDFSCIACQHMCLCKIMHAKHALLYRACTVYWSHDT